MLENPELSIILPVLNEEKSISSCLSEIMSVINKNELNAEIIIVDNGSTDRTRDEIFKLKGVLKNTKLVKHTIRGYGSAYLRGFEVANGKYIFMADADGSYDFNEIPKFLESLRKGYDFVIGNRFNRNMEKGAMPWHHRLIGNPILSGILRLFFKTKVGDSHCGMRAIRKNSLKKLDLRTTGMEFASEMVIKAAKKRLRIMEIPIKYHKRKGDSKLRSFRDGWRHLRFMLLYAPLFLFFIPGIFLFLVGLTSMILFYFINVQVLMIQFYYHPMFISSIFMLVGYQIVIFSLFAKTYAINHLGEPKVFDEIYRHVKLERVILFSGIMVLFSLILFGKIFVNWWWFDFNPLEATKDSIIALTLLMLGVQSVFSAFMLSVLGIKEKGN